MFRRLFSAFALLVAVLLGGLGLAAVAFVPDPVPRHDLLLWVGGALAVGLAGAALCARVVAGQLARPLEELTQAFERMEKGNVGVRVFPTGKNEVSKLGESFNQTSEQLDERIAALEEERQQLRTILSGMVEGVVALDSDQRVLFVNGRAAELLELPGLTAVGRHLWEIVRHRPLLDAARQALGSPEPYREEFTWNGAATRSLTVHAARLPDDPPRGAVLVLHDTTELRRLERLRQEFVANVSHELKTPLSVIKVCVETLIDGAVEDVQHRGRFLDRIARQADRLHALILDLLSLARIESGEQTFDFSNVSLEAAARAAAERHRPRAEAKNQTLTLEMVEPLVPVWADDEAVDQILENLLDNALKYTPEGGAVCIRLACADGYGCVEVIDTGIGIPEPDLPRIFERFYRVDRARSRELGGTGLGLAIVKHLVQALRGNVRATSQVGAGTRFTVSLPLAGG